MAVSTPPTNFYHSKPHLAACSIWNMTIGFMGSQFGMVLMPNAGILTTMLPLVLMGAGMLMAMDATFNVTKKSFRAWVANV